MDKKPSSSVVKERTSVSGLFIRSRGLQQTATGLHRICTCKMCNVMEREMSKD